MIDRLRREPGFGSHGRRTAASAGVIGPEDKTEAVDEKKTRNWQPLQDRATGCYHRLSGRAMNFRYPIFLDLTGKKCVVTGEGFEVAAKVRGLVEASADVLYINPRAVPEIEALVSAGSSSVGSSGFLHGAIWTAAFWL